MEKNILLIGSLPSLEEALRIKPRLKEFIKKLFIEEENEVYFTAGKFLGNLISAIIVEICEEEDYELNDQCLGFIPPIKDMFATEKAEQRMEDFRNSLFEEINLVIAINGGTGTKKEIQIAEKKGIPVEVKLF